MATLVNMTSCLTTVPVSASFINIATLPMLGLIIAMSFVIRRKHKYPYCCAGRPGILIPINFVWERRGRPALAAVFVILTSRLTSLVFGAPYWLQNYYLNPQFYLDYNYVFVLVKSVNVVQLSVCFYPLLACIHHHKIIGFNLLGILMLIPWVYFTALGFQDCVTDFENMTKPAVFRTLIDLPELLSYAIVILFCLKMGYRTWRLRRRSARSSPLGPARGSDAVQKTVSNTYGSFGRSESVYLDHSIWCCVKDDAPLMSDPEPQLEAVEKEKSYIAYVRALLKRKTRDDKRRFATLREEFTYRQITGLRTSPRIIVTLACGFFALYAISWQVFYVIDLIRVVLDTLLQNVIDHDLLPSEQDVSQVQDIIDLFYYGSETVNISSMILQSAALWRVFVNYRKDTRTMLRGDCRKFQYADLSYEYLLLCNTYYSGYQIIFAFYAYVMTFVLLFLIIVVTIGGLTCLPLKWGLASPVVTLIQQYWLTLVISILIYVGQYYFVKYFFMTSDSKQLYTNRRLYHVVDYFMFFFNTLLSLFTSLKSVLLSLLYGIMYMARLDQCRMVHGYEAYDSGHNAYLGVLYMQRMLNNPTVRAFADLLLEERNRQVSEGQDSSEHVHAELRLRKHRIRLRWYKAVTLINNPGLVVENLSKRVADDINKLTKSVVSTGTSVGLDSTQSCSHTS